MITNEFGVVCILVKSAHYVHYASTKSPYKTTQIAVMQTFVFALTSGLKPLLLFA